MSDPVTPKDKPNARRQGWHIEETTYPFRNQFLTLRQDKLIWPDGQTGSYSYVEIKPVVLIGPVTTTREVVLIRQYRYTIDDWVWEIPAGGSHDFEGDDLAELARKVYDPAIILLALATVGHKWSEETLVALGVDTLHRKVAFKRREGFDVANLLVPARITETPSPAGPFDEAFIRTALAHYDKLV